MAHSPGTYADLDALRERAVALRRAGHSLRQIRDELKIFNNDVLNRLVKGEPPPEWTKRPRAKDDLRARARELRLQGWTYDRIETELGCSRSSVSLWVRDLPRPERKRTREEASAIARKGWEEKLRLRDEDRRHTKEVARQAIGGLSARELFLVGVGLYWAEGGKDKPYDRRENVTFVNSDPGMIEVFLAWLDLLEVERDRLRFTVMIHETADVGAAERYWADLVGAPSSSFNKTTIKKHNPKTVRKNTGDGYRGCLVIKVLKGADLYRRIEGSWYGIVEAAREADQPNRT
ncbi:helix-turn-helix domain-containing protein [Streptomyces sp. NPDC015684]|uniref:helix-turn-helix domain-containing protein n=1 Tax=unclassified Streptomyces TaxID=2593676 RepID=UPI0036F544A4